MQQNTYKTGCAAPGGCPIYTPTDSVYCAVHKAVFSAANKIVSRGTCVLCPITSIHGSKYCYGHTNERRSSQSMLAVSI